MTKNNKETYTVYKHTLPKNISGKDRDMVYIGITSQTPPKKRWQNGSPYRYNNYFYNAIQKYGFDNFSHEVLLNGLTKEEAEQKEIELIAKYKSNNRNFGYNIANGGNCVGTVSQETKNKISKANMGNQYSLGHKHTEATRTKMSESAKGNQRGKGKKMPEHVKQMLAESHKTESFRRKLSEANKGKKQSEETRKKNSESHKGLGSKRVVCIETEKIYNSIKDAAEQNKIKGHGHISSCCKGDRQTAGGYHWCFEDDYNEENIKELLQPKIDKHCKSVLCVETGRTYDSILDAASDIGISPSRITEYCKGKASYAGKLSDGTKLHWEYIDL